MNQTEKTLENYMDFGVSRGVLRRRIIGQSAPEPPRRSLKKSCASKAYEP